ncbi:MAG: ankyrin repeat domain-containing protein, partial [bacterium]|nr:ankyrin repeat domain-containing protein [bacterium]
MATTKIKLFLLLIVILGMVGLNASQHDQLYQFCRSGNEKELKNLIKAKINLNLGLKPDSTTALMAAVEGGHLQIIKLLVENGADINAKRKFGYTSLMIAIQRNQVEIAKYLIKVGADIHMFTNINDTPLMFAVEKCQTELLQLLIQKGADVNIRNKTDIFPLFQCGVNGCVEAAKILINAGAEVNARSKPVGETALMKAAFMGHGELVRLLIQN